MFCFASPLKYLGITSTFWLVVKWYIWNIPSFFNPSFIRRLALVIKECSFNFKWVKCVWYMHMHNTSTNIYILGLTPWSFIYITVSIWWWAAGIIGVTFTIRVWWVQIWLASSSFHCFQCDGWRSPCFVIGSWFLMACSYFLTGFLLLWWWQYEVACFLTCWLYL